MTMQKEKFQEYLYDPETYRNADLSELKEVLREYPWFSTAGIILLTCSKMQSDPEFDLLLIKYSPNITSRKVLSKLLFSGTGNKTNAKDPTKEKMDIQDNHSRIDGIFDSPENNISANNFPYETNSRSALEDDSLLDFSYSSKKPEKVISTNYDVEVTDSDAIQDLVPQEDEDFMTQSETGEQNFDHWIEKLGGDSEIEKSPYKRHEIIESFIHSDPGVIRADKISAIQGDVSKSSAEENEGFITDTLAKIYVKQGLYNKAIYAYEKLCLKYPEKSIYFASQIEEIRNLYIKK